MLGRDDGCAAAAWSAVALVAVSPVVLGSDDGLVLGIGPLELDDDPPAECDAERVSVVVALDVACLTSFSASAVALIGSSSLQMRSNANLHASECLSSKQTTCVQES